ncbi:MAG: hypothetical protein OXI97_11425 [Acidimicrobiaceae bacterium]|nr:hypothetical protein [Acidimicrobiaceae bacterium]
MRLFRLAARLAAVAVLAASLLVAAASPAQAQCSEDRKAELAAQITTLTAQIDTTLTTQIDRLNVLIEQFPTDEALRDQRRIAQARGIAQAQIAACGEHDALPTRFTSAFTYQGNPQTYTFAPSTVNQGSGPAAHDRFVAAYDAAIEQAIETAQASTTPDGHHAAYSAGFRVTGTTQNRDGETEQYCNIVIQTITYSPHNPGESPRWTATALPDGRWQRVLTDVGHC